MLHSGKFGCVTTFVMALNSNLKLKNVTYSQFKYVIHFLCSTLSKIQIHKIHHCILIFIYILHPNFFWNWHL